MKYARFHPEYSDVGDYFDAVGRKFGLAEQSERKAATPERVEEAAQMLGLDTETLAHALRTRGAVRGAPLPRRRERADA